MKIELERGSTILEIDQQGRHIFITEGDDAKTRGFFDEGEAREAFAGLVAEARAAGYVDSARQRQKDEASQKRAAARADVEARIAAARAAAAPKDGARLLLRSLAAAPSFNDLVDRVEGVDDDGDLVLRGGARLVVSLHVPQPMYEVAPWFKDTLELSQLWLFLDAESDDHNLFFGAEAGPPDGDAVLEDTAYADASVEWFLQEWPTDRYWFFAGDAAHAWEADGSVNDSLTHRGPLAHLVVARLLVVLNKG